MVSRLFMIVMCLLVVSQGFNGDFHHARSVSDQNYINCLNDAEVLKALVFTSVQNLADGIYIFESLEDMRNYWSIFPQWFTVCQNIISAPNQLGYPFPEIDFEIIIGEEGIYINEILYVPEVLNRSDPPNCIYALFNLANLLSELKATIEEQNYGIVANLIYSLKDIKDGLSSACP
ncbi:hypothetical protein SteCoe_22999 [Stentor coeruleus]|uniref:Uncharacterized protein n=1 Tax=Stentor coeruleus TaxID=5963 RepID=A0A1R2BKU8_9CILI|nr:hypothetical protein SteCoe_22999 [Stentor coeruleus]